MLQLFTFSLHMKIEALAFRAKIPNQAGEMLGEVTSMQDHLQRFEDFTLATWIRVSILVI